MPYYYSYEEFKQDSHTLLHMLQELNIDTIVGIARGGLSLSHALAEGLGIREVQTLRTELYDQSEKRETITIQNNCSFDSAKKVLVVDDIADSGDTLQAVMAELESKNPQIKFYSCALFYKKTSVYEPSFWVREAKEWIDFFWEKDFKAK